MQCYQWDGNLTFVTCFSVLVTYCRVPDGTYEVTSTAGSFAVADSAGIAILDTSAGKEHFDAQYGCCCGSILMLNMAAAVAYYSSLLDFLGGRMGNEIFHQQ